MDALSEDLLAPIWKFYNSAYVEKAEKMVKEDQYASAEEILRKGYEETREDPWIAYKLGELYGHMNKIEDAELWLKIAVKYLPLLRYKKNSPNKNF
ncbi:MAG: tetratricopeptide repeat protein [Candidatus Bathyarchaeia archaeon]